MADKSTEHALERLIFFSDAVFAIAITLLVIEIHVPHLEGDAGDAAYLQALAGLIPSFVGFVVSFGVIGMFWAGHHRAFNLAGHYDRRILPWNLMLLGAIAFIPFVTAFFSAHPGARVPAMLYWSWLVLTALLNRKVNATATRPPMLAEGVAADLAVSVPRRSLSVVLGAVTSFVIAAFLPYAAPAGMITIPLWRRLLERKRAAQAGTEG